MRRFRRSLIRRFNARFRPYRFLIYALPRSGSTSLVKVLNAYAGIECANEPFNLAVYPDVRGRVTDLPSLQREFAWLWRRFNGFKHICEFRGWPFAEQPLLEDYIVTSAPKTVILLHRRNLLRRIASHEISRQSQIWHVNRGDERAKLLEHPFKPLDRAAIRQRLEEERQAFAEVQRRLDRGKVRYRIISYEDLFGDASEEQRIAVLREIIAFITRVSFNPKRLQREALRIMDPQKSRVNSAETYELVPSIHEVEDEFGCDETGYLFR